MTCSLLGLFAYLCSPISHAIVFTKRRACADSHQLMKFKFKLKAAHSLVNNLVNNLSTPQSLSKCSQLQ